MEFEQIIKRLDFLEKQQREGKDALAPLKEKIASLETTANATSKQVKALNTQVTNLTPATRRVDQFESILTKQRAELIKMIEDNEKARIRENKEAAKQTQSEILELNKTVAQMKSAFDLTDLKKAIKERGDEIQRLGVNVADLKLSIDETRRSNEDLRHLISANDEARKNDLKRIADLQGEFVSLRKRIDENREKATVHSDAIRNMEGRIAEIFASEIERKQAQVVFIDQQRIAQTDRERVWKNWQDQVSAFEKEAQALDQKTQQLDEALRGVKRAQDTYVELSAKLERRINEVTEMQRLAEERLRQEWISFKADDQKRWTGHSLSSEESFRDIRKETQKYDDRIVALNEATEILQDQIHQTTDAAEKQLQELMNVVHEWMTSYQRIMGHGKKAKK
ncbi:MAG: hypothetical protein LC099_04670 [Anaerolineales bacterium]|nr:hypothetical protein [Anaerolineales bacterium]